MDTILVLIGNDIILDKTFNISRFFAIMSDKGFDISNIITVSETDNISYFIKDYTNTNIILCGETDSAYFQLINEPAEGNLQFFEYNTNQVFLMPEFNEVYVKDILIPVFNSNSKMFYNTVIYNVFGLTEYELKNMLSEQMTKSKLTYNIYKSSLELSLHVRYSSNVPSSIINDTTYDINRILKQYIFSKNDCSLIEVVATSLQNMGKSISIVETFTKGGLTYELSKNNNFEIPLCESIIINDKTAMIENFDLSNEFIQEHGIISDETAYVIAGKMLENSICDLAIAVIGVISHENDDEDCNFYIGVGDKTEIHVFSEHYFGTKEEVIDAGIKHSAFALYKFLNKQ